MKNISEVHPKMVTLYTDEGGKGLFELGLSFLAYDRPMPGSTKEVVVSSDCVQQSCGIDTPGSVVVTQNGDMSMLNQFGRKPEQ